MAALSDLSDIINRVTGGNSGAPEHIAVWIDNRIGAAAADAPTIGRWSDLWRYNKSPGSAHGSAPASVIAPNRTTLGALGQANAAAGKEKWLLGVEGLATRVGILMLYDRLLQVGGLSGTVTSAQAVGGTLTRNTGGVGNQIWVHITTAIGTTGTTITCDYTDDQGNAATTPAVAIGGTGLREATRLIPLPLADGDVGVQAVEDVTLAGTTGTAGDFGVIVVRPIATFMASAAGLALTRDFLSDLPSIPKIDDDACLAWAWASQEAAAPQLFLQTHFIEK
jgi:hypothetical protein